MNRLGAMEAFVRVVDAGSFCGAAKQLRIGQPAVSKTNAQLEERPGVRPVLRSTHDHTPTEAASTCHDRYNAPTCDACDRGVSWGFRKGTSETSVTLSGRLRVSASEGIREGVLAGLGFAVASEWVFASELKSGAVISILDDWSLPAVDLWAVFPAGRQSSVKARAFASFIEAEMSNAEFAGQESSCSVSHIVS